LSNVLILSSLRYFQTPNALVDDLLTNLKLAPLKLYLLIMRKAQQHSRVSVEITSAEVMRVTGIKENALKRARDALAVSKLVRSERLNNQGLWSYRLLNPFTGEPISDPRLLVDLDALTADQVRHYFLCRLERYDIDHDPSHADQLRARCPFHNTTKHRDKPLSIQVTGGGVWQCFRCNKTGRLIDLEKGMVDKELRQTISNKDAIVRICRIVDGAGYVLPEMMLDEEQMAITL